MSSVISEAFDSCEAIDERYIPELEEFGFLHVGIIKEYMKDFVTHADAILNGNYDYFQTLRKRQLYTYMEGAHYESIYQQSLLVDIWLCEQNEDFELRFWACEHRMRRCNQALVRLYREFVRRKAAGSRE